MQKGCKFGIFDLIALINDISVSMRQLMNTILNVDPLRFHSMYHSPCYIT